MAEEDRTVYLPMMFSAEGEIRTSACLQVTERTYPQSAWWEDSDVSPGTPEHAFKAVISAMKRKDRAARFELSDPAPGKDPERLDEQVVTFIQQFESSIAIN